MPILTIDLDLDGDGNPDVEVDVTLLCFLPGTLISTPAGPVAIETLKQGDLVTTAQGESKPVRWVGRQTVSKTFADPNRFMPIRVKAGALGDHVPARDLFVSPGHALLIDGVLVEANALVNGSSVARHTDMPETFCYYNVELAEHSLMQAEGAAVETFVDNVSRANFDNWAEHEALVGAAPIAEMDIPRVKSARQLPMAIRHRLAARAAELIENVGVAKAA